MGKSQWSLSCFVALRKSRNFQPGLSHTSSLWPACPPLGLPNGKLWWVGTRKAHRLSRPEGVGPLTPGAGGVFLYQRKRAR